MTNEQLIVIGLSITAIWLYVKLNKTDKLNKSLSEKIVMLEAEQLKFQLQPHTLNNILANLNVIANKLNKGLSSLSETLEYILYKGNTHLVTVEDEMNFIKKYLALNDLFISEIDSIKFDSSQVDANSKYFTSACVPHLITAYFIENAFKHGDVNHPEFLKINLKLSENTFEMNVVNRIKQKPNVSKGGIGLNNMKKRLNILMTGRYEINNDFDDQEYHSTLIIRFV